MIKKYWGIRYFNSKLKQQLRLKKDPTLPWLPYETIRFLDQYLKNTDVMLETGSGRSTIWFAQRTQKVVSIEHDEGWFNICKEKLGKAGLKNVEYFLENRGENINPSASPYVQRVKAMADHSFDFILVDGKLRSTIALISLDKVKNGGLISIDNIERELYLPAFSLPDSLTSSSPVRPEWKTFLERTANNRKVVLSDGITANMLVFM